MRGPSKNLTITVALGLLFLSTAIANAQNAAIQRPIQDFVGVQGTYCFDVGGTCVIFVPPVANFIGLDDPYNRRCMSVDYAGLADAWIKGA